MACVQKFTSAAVVNQLRHNERTIAEPANKDIDHSRSNQNYSLCPDRGTTAYDYFLKRKNELYCYGRSDLKVMAGWVITAPTDLPADQYDAFFKSCHTFLAHRYGEENCIQSIVHYDESGQPHLHYCFIPVVPDKKHGGEKICANDVLTPKELRNFHPDLVRHLKADCITASILTGITQQQGGNKTVKQLKQERWEHQQKHQHTVEMGRWN